ncbi:MAG: hypothetical protein R6V44_03420 [Paracoccaceae bacterium]
MDVVIHLGAHRTGSTALQRSLATGAARLEAAGPRYARREAMRRPLHVAMLAAEARGPVGRGARSAAARALRAWARRQEAAGVSGLILSEEELPGVMDDCLTGEGPYPRAARRLSLLAEAFAPWRMQAAALREPAGWVASTWGYSASRRDPRRRDRRNLAAVRRGWLEGGRGWSAFAADVAGTFDGASFWRADLYAAAPRRVHRLLAGEAGAGLRQIGGATTKPGPTAPAMAELERLRADARRIPRSVLTAVLQRFPPGAHPKFDPWSAEERAVLAARWVEEMAAIRARGLTVLAPPGPGAAQGDEDRAGADARGLTDGADARETRDRAEARLKGGSA